MAGLVQQLLEAHRKLSMERHRAFCPACGVRRPKPLPSSWSASANAGHQCLSCQSTEIGVRCGEKGCASITSYGKPFCVSHVESMPYVIELQSTSEAF